ncbi:MAG: tetratricopeptide repeat protein [Motiliproteus sp.]
MVGRNDKCPCGSKKKFKKCCGITQQKKHGSGSPDLNALFMQAVNCHQSNNLDQAQQLYQNVLRHNPKHADATHYIGLIAYQRQQYPLAITTIKKAITLNDKVGGYYTNLGNAYKKNGQQAEAIEVYRRAVRIDPNLAAAHFNLGSLLLSTNQEKSALQCLQQAVKLAPGNATFWQGLGNALYQAEDIDKAFECFEKALSLNPNSVETLLSLGNILQRFGQVREALIHMRKAEALSSKTENGFSAIPFALNYIETDPQAIFDETLSSMQPLESGITAIIHPPMITPDNRRLRIGYLSYDLRKHAMRFFIEPVLRAHDRSKFEIVCYYSHPKMDQSSLQLKDLSDQWVNCATLSDEALVQKIQQDQIDILVDLSGLTAGARLGVMARKPAPIQMTMLGYLNTTGLRRIDYRIADTVTSPPGLYDNLSTEEILRLPNSQWCYQPSSDAPEVNDLPAKHQGHITFGAIHNMAKVTPEMVAIWSKILVNVPGSRLMMIIWGDTAKSHMLKLFAQHNISAERLLIEDPVPYEQYLSKYNQIDIALDSYPYSGGTTSCESLWMGVPYVTYAGPTPTSRGGASILTALHLTELIAENLDDYIQRATTLAADLDRLQQMRAGLREKMKQSPLMDESGYTKALEQLYLKAVESAGSNARQNHD